TGEEARKHVEPPRLATLVVAPAQVTVGPGKKQTFTAKGLDQHGGDIDAGQVGWTATGGKVDLEGGFQSGPDEGSFLVTATAGGVRGTGSVTVAKKPPVREEPTSLSWEGQVPAQKWMNFYTKVLSKFAVSKGLKLTVRFELGGDAPI